MQKNAGAVAKQDGDCIESHVQPLSNPRSFEWHVCHAVLTAQGPKSIARVPQASVFARPCFSKNTGGPKRPPVAPNAVSSLLKNVG